MWATQPKWSRIVSDQSRTDELVCDSFKQDKINFGLWESLCIHLYKTEFSLGLIKVKLD